MRADPQGRTGGEDPHEASYRVYGRTRAGRYLFVALLLYEDREEALPLAARDMTDK